MLNVSQIMSDLTFEEKCRLLTGSAALSTASVERLGIPSLELSDGPHGVRRMIEHPTYPQECHVPGGDTVMPVASAVGASWNPDVAFAAGVTIGKDCKKEGVDVILAPGVNMKRNAHCGRNFEYYSEDPYLSALLAAGFINGVQSEGIGTSLKHYAVNSQEILRGTINAEVDERTLREYYLRQFDIIMKHCDPTSVMCAYNKLNGIWCSENRYLLTEILKDTWGYSGMVISDWGAVHNMPRAIKAGLDLQMPKNGNIEKHIRWGLDNGIISMEDVDRAVRKVVAFVDRILEMRQEPGAYDRAAQHESAYHAACECITLLRNDNNTLPFTLDKVKRIAVVGSAAHTMAFMGGGSSCVSIQPESVDQPLPFMKNNDLGIEVDFIDIADANRQTYTKCGGTMHNYLLPICKQYDAVVYFASNNFGPDEECEEFDRTNLSFPNYMNYAIERAMEANKNFVLVLQSGSAILPKGWEKIPTLIQMGFAGEAAGRAVADILFGKVNPSGKLSETYPLRDRTDLDYPGDGTKICYREKYAAGYRYYDRNPQDVWFPFGHGLSYTTFGYTNLVLSQTEFTSSKFTLNVGMKLKNTGSMAGKEVVQLYVAPLDNITDRPVKELKRFAKILLQPGEETDVSFTLTDEDFAYFNTCLHDWHVESGRYQIMIGSSCTKIELSEQVQIHYIEDYTIENIDTSMVL